MMYRSNRAWRHDAWAISLEQLTRSCRNKFISHFTTQTLVPSLISNFFLFAANPCDCILCREIDCFCSCFLWFLTALLHANGVSSLLLTTVRLSLAHWCLQSFARTNMNAKNIHKNSEPHCKWVGEFKRLWNRFIENATSFMSPILSINARNGLPNGFSAHQFICLNGSSANSSLSKNLNKY